MKEISYIVYSPGRTGSTLIVNNLNAIAEDSAYVVHDRRFVPNQTIPHTDVYVPISPGLTCIRSLRRNIFDATVSELVLEQTGEASVYTGQQQKITIPGVRFMEVYKSYLTFRNHIDTSMYNHVADVWFEDMIADEYYLFRQLGIDRKINYNLCERSPYRYADMVTNIEELEKLIKNRGWQRELH